MKVIDYVVPMVFPEDPLWRRSFFEAWGDSYDNQPPLYTVRYRSWGFEELHVRCVRKFMPWVRDIIVLLASESQRQPWMGGCGIRVVYHKDFIPTQYLPTFSSRTIEVFLHLIPGLSEHFIYANDDTFAVATLQESDFFRDGLPCQHHTLKAFPSEPNLFHLASLRGLNMVAGLFGKKYTDTWLKCGHSLSPIVKETCRLLWDCCGRVIEDSVSRFRDDKSFNQYIYGWWHHLSGRYVDHVPPRKYISTRNDIDTVRRAIRDCGGVICINDNECVEDIAPYAAAVREEIENKLATDSHD